MPIGGYATIAAVDVDRIRSYAIMVAIFAVMAPARMFMMAYVPEARPLVMQPGFIKNIPSIISMDDTWVWP